MARPRPTHRSRHHYRRGVYECIMKKKKNECCDRCEKDIIWKIANESGVVRHQCTCHTTMTDSLNKCCVHFARGTCLCNNSCHTTTEKRNSYEPSKLEMEALDTELNKVFSTTDTSDWRERWQELNEDKSTPQDVYKRAIAFIEKELERARDNDAQIIETLKDTIEGHKKLVPFFIKDGQAIERDRIIALAEETIAELMHEEHEEGDGETREHHIRYSGHNNALGELKSVLIGKIKIV